MKDIKNAVNRMVNNIRIAIRGEISSVKADDTVFLKISDEEELRDINIISPYGLYSLPINGSTGHILFNNTNKNISLVGIEHDKKPIKINIGEVLIYNSVAKTYMHFKNDGKLYIEAPIVVKKGTKDVARKDDTVEVDVPGIGKCTGKITSGSSNIKV